MSVTIREARDDELDRVGELLVASYVQYLPSDPGDDAEAWEAYFRDIADVRSRMHDAVLLVAEDDGRLVGSVTYYPPSGDESVGEGWPAGWAAFRLLAVAPAERGRGIGRLLAEECLRRARAAGAPHMGLHTTTVMDVARAMYERMGFTRVPEFDFHPTPRITVMAYRLDL